MKRLVTFLSCFVLSIPFLIAQTKDTGLTGNIEMNNHSYIALKTNLLYDAILIPNIGVEFNVYNNLTLYGDIQYADWNLPKKHVYWDYYGAQVGVRKYFGRRAKERSFTGHHAGIFGQAMAYDFQAGHIGQQTPTLNLGIGVEYGYSIPIALGFNIDFDLGVGFISGSYYEYDVKDGHNTWRGTINRRWLGPTRASISLVWMIKSNKMRRNSDETME